MKIEILGSGCDRCQQLAANTEQAVRDAGIEADIEKVVDIGRITAYGVLLTPALVVDGHVRASGDVLSPERIRELISST